MSSVFGKSLSFPPRIGADGRFVWSAGEDNIRESIAVILKTQPGERVGVPEFGAGLSGFLFEPNTVATHARMRDAIERALGRWERRIQVEAVEVREHPQSPEVAVVDIVYRLVATDARERIGLTVPLTAV